MAELLQMWAMVEVLGFVCLPLTVTVFHNLPDRGWAFSKAIGTAVLAFCVWFPLMCLSVLPFSQFFITGIFLLLLAGNIIGFLKVRQTIAKVVRVNVPYILISEAVFAGMMFLLGWIRSFVPDIRSFEMFMDEGFIAGIIRSPHFPPNDMWFAGYPINYYYYAHFTAAILGKLLGQSPSIVFNTGICMFFGLTAVSLFGVTSNIVSWAQHLRKRAHLNKVTEPQQLPGTSYPSLLRAVPYGFLTMLMGLVLGNLAATQQWWEQHGDWTQFNWFNPSRVVDRTINEFPAFSFLLSCFHAHVLALAFTIVAIALAFNLFLEQEGWGLRVFGRGWKLPLTMATTALILGGLFAMNGWDFPTYVGLTVVCIAFQQYLAHRSRFRLELLLDIFTVCAGLIALSFLMYVPFYFTFISPSQGLGVVGPADRSPLANEILIYGMFAFVFLSLLLATVFRHPFFTRSTAHSEDIVAPQPARLPRFNKGVMSVLLVIGVALLTLFALRNSATFVAAGSIAALGCIALFYSLRDRSQAFILLLGSTAFALVAVCEVFFLKDVFAGGEFLRMNTVFKFYFQAWALLSITSGAGIYFIL